MNPALIGVGEIPPARSISGRTGLGMATAAARACLRDARIEAGEVDGLIAELPFANPAQLAEHLGLRTSWAHSVGVMGASACSAVALASAMIRGGEASAILCVVSSSELGGRAAGSMRYVYEPGPRRAQPGPSGSGASGVLQSTAQFEEAYGPGRGGAYQYAMLAHLYAYEYGLGDEDRVALAVQERRNARAHPDAIFRDVPLSSDDVLSSPLVADPLHLFECAMPTLGAAAVVVADAERAADSSPPPVYVLGTGYAQAPGLPGLEGGDLSTVTPVTASAEAAFRMAGIAPPDIGLVLLYDCYTIAGIIQLEDAGFCSKGEGAQLIASTDCSYAGALPINTHGGLLSYGHSGYAGGMSLVVEAVRQLRSSCGDRQVDGLTHAFVTASGGVLSMSSSLVLGN